MTLSGLESESADILNALTAGIIVSFLLAALGHVSRDRGRRR